MSQQQQPNEYDNPQFFEKYKEMARSKYGLAGAGEWHELEKMLPDFNHKRVLDLGCGYGWHCLYAAEHGASQVAGIDSSVKMIEVAKLKSDSPVISYHVQSMEEVDYPADSFDVVISSLAFHYVASFDDICARVKKFLVNGGDFVFSVENPIFTAYGTGDWHYDTDGKPLHWPVDRYFEEGVRKANFLGHDVYKYHKTMSTYINALVKHGFKITKVVEPLPEESMIASMPDELRRPMMLLISAKL
ncbi:SAM-dependent methyltransferase [Mucor ambiguus]|uniref:SAM-dependent methyltransferase n=1 Tax=Mucor ambiguus TaxID=91626 RepID=A0A0C9LX72_9FUNG|nr:SAM-dependent methyltransferase [Mucor ambiguus]